MEKELWLSERVKSGLRDFWLDNAPRSGRPAETDSHQSETWTENNQRSTVQEIANTLKISKSIKLLMKMKNVSVFPEESSMDLVLSPFEL